MPTIPVKDTKEKIKQKVDLSAFKHLLNYTSKAISF